MPADDPQPKPRSENRKRQKLLAMRVTEEERAELHRRAELGGFSSVADMVRVRCLRRRPLRPRLDVQRLVDVQQAVNRVGVNVNQIAALAHKRGHVTRADVEHVEEALERVYDHLDSLFPQR